MKEQNQRRIMHHSKEYMLSHDIDWYFKYNEYFVHCASNGGMIPNICREIKYLHSIKKAVQNISQLLNYDELYINETHLSNIINLQREAWESLSNNGYPFMDLFDEKLVKELYLSSFLANARKGMVSFDRIQINKTGCNEEISENTYILVAAPKKIVRQKLSENKDYQSAFEKAYNIADLISFSSSDKWIIDIKIQSTTSREQ